MMHDAIAILGLGALCAGWVWLQAWIARRDPESQSILERGCHGRGDGGCGSAECRGRCRARRRR